jgi:hypothetical protein
MGQDDRTLVDDPAVGAPPHFHFSHDVGELAEGKLQHEGEVRRSAAADRRGQHDGGRVRAGRYEHPLMKLSSSRKIWRDNNPGR